jgi:hypothetical protein
MSGFLKGILLKSNFQGKPIYGCLIYLPHLTIYLLNQSQTIQHKKTSQSV